MNIENNIIETIKEARASKGLSQRALSKLTGITQAHISKIENGTVDIQLSSLTQIARALDLEVKLVPRKSLPAVDSIIKSAIALQHNLEKSNNSSVNSQDEKRGLQRPLYSLEDNND